LRQAAARALLAAGAHGKEPVTVTAVAEQTGFGSTQILHRWYRDRFGETPGETLRCGG
jgi:AraC-like DNA-binding protein